eukprot:TRINITY_DN92_c0_g9_i1.p1 TRINITY_DN92_c0_g9~~TRINITY_DN92_c0_g9_i1.p1  ORF type:complete len:163 (+),score=29.94 TRINITY_DN92_c0_g9_i1:22-489(+)
MTFGSILSLDNVAFRDLAVCSSLLGLKMLAFNPLTAHKRFATGSFANQEDTTFDGLPGIENKVQVNDDVERVRRAHHNDLENIPLFLAVAPLVLLSGSTRNVSLPLFATFTAARFMHTFFYLRGTQPARGISHLLSVAANVGMLGFVLYRAIRRY